MLHVMIKDEMCYLHDYLEIKTVWCLERMSLYTRCEWMNEWKLITENGRTKL